MSAKKTIAIKGNPLDQSSCNSFSELIHNYQVCKTVPLMVGSEDDQNTAKKAWSDYIVNCSLDKMDLTCDRKPLSYININPNDLNDIN